MVAPHLTVASQNCPKGEQFLALIRLRLPTLAAIIAQKRARLPTFGPTTVKCGRTERITHKGYCLKGSVTVCCIVDECREIKEVSPGR